MVTTQVNTDLDDIGPDRAADAAHECVRDSEDDEGPDDNDHVGRFDVAEDGQGSGQGTDEHAGTAGKDAPDEVGPRRGGACTGSEAGFEQFVGSADVQAVVGGDEDRGEDEGSDHAADVRREVGEVASVGGLWNTCERRGGLGGSQNGDRNGPDGHGAVGEEIVLGVGHLASRKPDA
ncbi:MAG: hypothetical protein NTV94_18680 [Planctomycetota bacterium]|nr:hypothetical protein [Planctomycetota bacterium]